MHSCGDWGSIWKLAAYLLPPLFFFFLSLLWCQWILRFKFFPYPRPHPTSPYRPSLPLPLSFPLSIFYYYYYYY